MLNVRRPAYSGIAPVDIQWQPLSSEEKELFEHLFDRGIIQTFQKKKDAHTGCLFGYYRSTGSNKNFIKVLDRNSCKLQLSAEKIALWLEKSKLSVSCAIGNYPKKYAGDDLWIYVYDYIEHNFFSGDEKELFFVGSELGKMHVLMQKYPLVSEVSVNGKKKNTALFTQLNKIRSNKLSQKLLPTRAIELIKNTTDKEFQVLFHCAQMIHGDMNSGNVIFKTGSSKPIFIDFEDSTTAWMSPLYDVAFVLQRFVLMNNFENKVQLALTFIKGYCLQFNLKSILSNGDLLIMLRMISIRSLLILSMLPNEIQSTFLKEIDKFVNLHREMLNKKSIILEIEKTIFAG